MHSTLDSLESQDLNHSIQASQPPNLSAAGLLTALGKSDNLLAINHTTAIVEWRSQAFIENFPLTDSSDEIDYLCQCFNGLEPHLIAAQDAQAAPYEFRVYCNTNSQWCDASLIRYNEQYSLLRFEIVDKAGSDIQRYLHDREKLFSTSRTISVSEMATTLAHELNQPIGTVTNLLQGVFMRLQRQLPEEPLLRAVEKAIEQATFAANIIARIRDYTASQKPRQERLNIPRLLSACVSLLDWEIERDHVQLTIHPVLESSGADVVGDETLLQQVFVNLLRNAIDAMRSIAPDKRCLTIRFSIQPTLVETIISDSGIGLTPTAEQQLFVPFASTKQTGMGVGLNICRSFVELHQGKLWLTNNNDKDLAVGCSAHVQLPLAPVMNADSSTQEEV